MPEGAAAGLGESGAGDDPLAAAALAPAGQGHFAMAAPASADPLAAAELAPAVVLGRIGGENFPVAMRWLPGGLRRDLVAIYGVARLIDEAGDAAQGDRTALLDALEDDLRAAFAGAARHPLLRDLTPVVRRHGLPPDPFLRLIEANRWDQRAPDIASFAELCRYCALSAAPVGELVLRLLGQASEANLADSAEVCAGLQVLEHCQDVAEDARAGRCYLPAEDRVRFACARSDLAAVPAPLGLRRCVALQVERARGQLARGARLCRRLRGLARPVVAAYAAGGWATADALERAGFDPNGPNARAVRPRRTDLARHALLLLLGRAPA